MTPLQPGRPATADGPHRSRHSNGKLGWLLAGAMLAAVTAMTGGLAAGAEAAANQRKALVIGRGDPYREPNGGMTHPQGAKSNFLKLVGNPSNDPAKGWTADLSWDLLTKLGMDPVNTPVETLFNYIGQHHLGYRIVIQNSALGSQASFWSVALDNGMMPFAPQGNNTPGLRIDCAPGFGPAVAVGGGVEANAYSYGPSLEFFDALPVWASHANFEDAAQSWANQAVAAKFAKVLDAHPDYNIYDARQFLRQSASYWSRGWTETNGYGRPNENARIAKLLPGPPLEFRTAMSEDHRHVTFSWRNFLQHDFAATVLARQDGGVIYEGAGTNFTWTSDVDGEATFVYWSKNTAGDTSRIESFQRRRVSGLLFRLHPTCLVFGAPVPQDNVNSLLRSAFMHDAPNWLCDIACRPGNAAVDAIRSFPQDHLVGVMPDYPAMARYAIANHYRLALVPLARGQEDDLFRYHEDWDRATAAGTLVITAHYFEFPNRANVVLRLPRPPRLGTAVTVGLAGRTNLPSAGPGLEFVDDGSANGLLSLFMLPNLAAARVAAKLTRIFDANPDYNIWDARQHLRQSASHYAAGWSELGGYGQPPKTPAKFRELDPAPPLDLTATRSADGAAVTFAWQNFLQSSYAETVIQRGDGRVIYHGTGTAFTWPSDVDGEETFRFFSRDKSGRLSRSEAYTVMRVSGLRRS